MGNLYTQIVRRQDDEIQTLANLKDLWRRYKTDTAKNKRIIMDKIKEQEEILENIREKRRPGPKTMKQKYGAFTWKAEKEAVG